MKHHRKPKAFMLTLVRVWKVNAVETLSVETMLGWDESEAGFITKARLSHPGYKVAACIQAPKSAIASLLMAIS